jgi:hypothetical protein
MESLNTPIKVKADLGEYLAVAQEQHDGTFTLQIYKDEEEFYDSPVLIYSLKDCSTWVRHKLNMKGKRIKWIPTK